MVDEVDEDGSVYVKMNGKLVKADPSTVEQMRKGTYVAPDAGPSLGSAAEDLGKSALSNVKKTSPSEIAALVSGDTSLLTGEELLKGISASKIVHPDSTATGEPEDTKTKTKPKDPALQTPEDTNWQDLADELSKSYGATIAALNPVNDSVAGQTAANDATMSSAAEADLGQSSTSPMAQWLNANTQAVASQSAATTAAEQAQVSAEDKGSASIQSALQGLGTAEQAQQKSAPYQQLLQSLAADVPYQLLQNNTLSAVDTSVQNALNQIGLSTKIPLTNTAPSLPSPTPNPASPLQTSLDAPTSSPAPQG